VKSGKIEFEIDGVGGRSVGDLFSLCVFGRSRDWI